MWWKMCITRIIIVSSIKVAILFIRLIATIIVIVAHFVPDNTNTVGFTLEFTVFATLRDMISTVQCVIQWFQMRFYCGFVYDEGVGDDRDGLFTVLHDLWLTSMMKWEEKNMKRWTLITTLNIY